MVDGSEGAARLAVDADDIDQPSKIDTERLFVTLKEWVTADMEHSAQWRATAKSNFEFITPHGQWSAEDRQALKDEMRPEVTFNKTLKFIKAVSGLEVNNRQMTTFLPRDVTNEGEVKANELLTNASDWMDQGAGASRQQSRAFRDTAICGMGWTEGTIEYDDNPKGKYQEMRVNPLEMGWDRNARGDNLLDSKRRWRVRKMTVAEARALIPGVTDADDITDSDLDAHWAAEISAARDPAPKTQEQKELREENTVAHDPKSEVYIVQVQWWEFESYVRTLNPSSNEEVDVSPEQYAQIKGAVMDKFGLELPGAQLRRRVYKQAFVGGKVLKVGPCPRADGFTFNCITGEADDMKGIWFGLVDTLRDPQVWTNKFFSQIMHIINSTAKGGIIAEEDAFVDIRDAQRNYARPQGIVVARNGAIAKGKIMAKPGTGLTGGVMSLLSYSDTMFSDVSGMNVEFMGLADRDQPGVLEAQRKQAAMTILAPLFDSLAAFRQEVGKMRLYYIQNYLADGRLIRVHGDDGQIAIPLIQDKTLGSYDVIVDDAPSSPNMKEKAWAGLSMVLPAFQDMMTPKVAALIVDYVPYLPSKLTEALKAMANEPPPPEAVEAEQRARQAAIAKDEGAAQASKAKAMLDVARVGTEQAKAAQSKVDSLLGLVGIRRPALPPMTEDPMVPNAPGPMTLPGTPQLPEYGADAQTGGMQSTAPGTVVLPGGLNGQGR